MRRSETIPQPFVLVVAEPNNWWGPRDELRWTVRLFGDAIMWSVYVVEAFLRIGERGLGRHRIPYRIEQVTQGVKGQVLWDLSEDRVRKAHPQPASEMTPPREQSVVRWQCHTPLHLRVDGRRATRIDGLDLVLAGRRRWALLQEFYGEPATNGTRTGGQDRVDRKDFETISSDLHNWSIERYSGRQHRKVPLQGVLGTIDIAGPWHLAGDWLKTVGQIGLGKSVTFGLGRISWEQIT